MSKSDLPDHLQQLALRVAQHEMGHYVMARLVGFQTGDVTLEIIGPIDGHRGGASITLARGLRTPEDVASYLRKRLLVLYAGALAETLRANVSPKTVDVEHAIEIFQKPGNGAESDQAKSAELLQLLRNIRFPDSEVSDLAQVETELDGLCKEIWGEAVGLVERHADTIVGLATNLACRVKQPRKQAVLDSASLEALSSVKALITL